MSNNIKCTNCGKEIAQKAPSCPKCGHPNKIANHLSGKESLLLLAPAFLLLWWLASGSSNTTKDSSSAATPTANQGEFITGDNYFGCTEKERHNALISMISQNDTAAFTKALRRSLASGECIQFIRGSKIFLQDAEMTTGLQRLRLEGEENSYWAVREATK